MATYEFAGAYDAAVLDTNSQLLKLTAFELVTEPGGVLATLYTNRTRSAVVAQPFLSDAEGNVHLFTDPGRYRLRQAGLPPGEEITVQPDPDETEGELEAHVIAADPHPVYLTAAEGNAAYAPVSEPVAAAHIVDPTDAHDASAVSNVPAGNIAATDVQAALNELDTEKATVAQAAGAAPVQSVFGRTGNVTALQADYDGFFLTPAEGNAAYAPISEPIAAAHISDPTDAHDASAISNVPAGNIAATDVQAALNELDAEKLGIGAPLTDGSVLFAEGGVIAQDNANFFWNNALNHLVLGGDTNLYRRLANNLTTDDTFAIQAATVGTVALEVFTPADSAVRLGIAGDGDLSWGPGNAPPDANLGRLGPGLVGSDHKIVATQGLGVGNSALATTPGTVIREIEVFDTTGLSIGFLAVYDAIT